MEILSLVAFGLLMYFAFIAIPSFMEKKQHINSRNEKDFVPVHYCTGIFTFIVHILKDAY